MGCFRVLHLFERVMQLAMLALERTSYEVYFFKKSEYSTTHMKCEYHFLRKQKISLVRSAISLRLRRNITLAMRE